MNNQSCTMSDKEIMTDLLTSQKHLTCEYNTFCNETATPEVSACLLSILRDEHTIAKELFDTMSSRGWYPVERAEETKLSQAKSQFQQFANA